MKLNQLPNFRAEDFPTQQSWIGNLFTQLNPLVQTLSQIFDNNIDYASNIKSVTRTYTITSFQAFRFSWPFAGFPPQDVRITKALKGTQKTPTILLPAWTYDAAQLSISISTILEVLSTGNSELSGTYEFIVRAQI